MLHAIAHTLPRLSLAILLTAPASVALAENLMEAAEVSGTFKHFIAAAKSSGVNTTLMGDGPYTVFAPTDEAVSKFGEDRWKMLARDRAQMAQLLQRHVMPGKVLITEIKPGPVETLANRTILLKSDNGKVTVGPANVTQSDITASNGVIHAIDTVLTED